MPVSDVRSALCAVVYSGFTLAACFAETYGADFGYVSAGACVSVFSSIIAIVSSTMISLVIGFK
jgi:hypothetical protein